MYSNEIKRKKKVKIDKQINDKQDPVALKSENFCR